MAVPKKRTGHSAQGKRRSKWKASKPELTTCPNCGAKVLTHTVCTACGQYKGKVVSRKASGFVDSSENAKSFAKSSKKAEKMAQKAEISVKETKTEVAEEKEAEVSTENKPEDAENLDNTEA